MLILFLCYGLMYPSVFIAYKLVVGSGGLIRFLVVVGGWGVRRCKTTSEVCSVITFIICSCLSYHVVFFWYQLFLVIRLSITYAFCLLIHFLLPGLTISFENSESFYVNERNNVNIMYLCVWVCVCMYIYYIICFNTYIEIIFY